MNRVIRQLVLTVAGPQGHGVFPFNRWVDGCDYLAILTVRNNVGLDRCPIGLTRIVFQVGDSHHSLNSRVANYLVNIESCAWRLNGDGWDGVGRVPGRNPVIHDGRINMILGHKANRSGDRHFAWP